MNSSTIGAVVVAAGSGTRLGADQPKALVEVAGRPLVCWAVACLTEASVPPPVVVHPPGMRADFAVALAGFDLAALVDGGETRTDSVRAGVAALSRTVERVVVHDAARPLVPPTVVTAVLDAVAGDVVAAAPALRIADTVKRVDGSAVVATVDRSDLVVVQTPQVFAHAALDAVLAIAVSATDELALVEQEVAAGRLRGRVVVVAGSVHAHKVTTLDDLRFVEQLARGV
ncbi:MAG: 2-C-methyl-D-erythritol 4-phosphate cytidylyltransferase [Nitriliruptoraceae bacterium]